MNYLLSVRFRSIGPQTPNMNIFLLFSPLKMAGFLRVKSGAGHHAGMAE